MGCKNHLKTSQNISKHLKTSLVTMEEACVVGGDDGFLGRNFFSLLLDCFFGLKLESSAASVLYRPLPFIKVVYRPLKSTAVHYRPQKSIHQNQTET
jgi:hypothetical protein